MTKIQADTLKGIAILQVVLIHILAVFNERWWTLANHTSWLLIFLDQLSRFSIPIFFFLSWYGLTQKYTYSSAKPWQIFLGRLEKLLPLYLLWSLGIQVIFWVVPQWEFASHLSWWQSLLLGQADYHLYFLPLIIMLYGTFALLRTLPKKWHVWFTPFVMAITWWWYNQIALDSHPSQTTLLAPDQSQYIIPLTWIWYAWLGLVASRLKLDQRFTSTWWRLALGSGVVLALWFQISETHTIINNKESVLQALKFTRWSVVITSSLMLLWLCSVSQFWQKMKHNFLSQVGHYSFLIYLAHTVAIRLTLSQYLHPVSWGQWLLAASIFGVILTCSLWALRVRWR